jgi:hypothetical protein
MLLRKYFKVKYDLLNNYFMNYVNLNISNFKSIVDIKLVYVEKYYYVTCLLYIRVYNTL